MPTTRQQFVLTVDLTGDDVVDTAYILAALSTAEYDMRNTGVKIFRNVGKFLFASRFGPATKSALLNPTERIGQFEIVTHKHTD